MVLKSEIEKSYLQQQEKLSRKADFVGRHNFEDIDVQSSMIQVVSGIRRCGKSTLLRQLMLHYDKVAFLNFEDPRIFNFELNDFTKLDEVIPADTEAYFFDEIQNVDKWEVYIRQLHDDGKKVFVTGSNASMLSKDLGTRLTGRYLNTELFPFSYNEFLRFNKQKASLKSYSEYLHKGGFPEFLKSDNQEVLQNLLKDIVYRDIAIRYGVRASDTLVNITLFLLSNIGKETTFNSLKKTFELGSANTVSDYLNWLQDAYMLFLVEKFSWSAKKRQVNPKKVYAIDNGLVKANTLSFTSYFGRLLENQVFLHLRRSGKEIYYFKEKKECDFVVFEKGEVQQIIQVCYEVNSDNFDREYSGLLEAMRFFNKKEGTIVTLEQTDRFEKDGFTVNLIPAFKFFDSEKCLTK